MTKEFKIFLIILWIFILLLILLWTNTLWVFIVSIISISFIYQVYISIFFESKKFKTLKDSIKENIKNSNDLNNHIEMLKSSYVNIKSYDYGESYLEDTSNFNFTRKEWENDTKNNQIHNCSLTVCKNAHNQPFKYLCKYFDIKINEETLSNFENVLNNFSSVEEGKLLLKEERDSILENISIDIPKIIYLFSKKRLTKELGFNEIDFNQLYFPTYTFQYISAWWNSSLKSDIILNIENLNKFIVYLDSLIKFKKSVEWQRALMTSKLREQIKIRDNYICQKCGLSAKKENNLLLEIDHIIPLSKGGITSEDNLQTLCRKCNRSKWAKLETL